MKRYFSVYAGLKKEVYILALAKLVNCMGSFIWPLLTLILTQKLFLSGQDAGKLLALLTVTQAPCVIAGGKLADLISRKLVFFLGNGLGAFFYLLCAFGAQGNRMILFLILAADMIAFAIPTEDAMLADAAPENERQSAFSLLYLAINVGMAVSPILGGILFLHHLRLLFFIDAMTTLLCIAVICLGIREPQRGQHKVQTEEKKENVTLVRAMKEAPVLMVFILLLFLYNIAYSQWNFLLPIQFGNLFGDDGARLFSYLCSANALTVILFTPLVTKLEKPLRALTAIGLAGLFYLAAYIGFGLEGPYALYLLMVELFTLGEICSTIRIGPFLYHYAPPSCRARIAATESFMRGAAGALGPLFMGKIITDLNCRIGWFLAAGCVLAGTAGIFLLDARMRKLDAGGRNEYDNDES